MNTSDNSLNKVKDFSAEKPSDYNLLLLKNKIFNKVDQTLEVKKFEEGEYFDDILSVINKYSWILSHVDSHEEEKHIHDELVYRLWHINDMVELPNEYRFLMSETKNVVSRVKEWWNFNIWLNSYLVPGSLSSLRKLLEYWVIKEKEVSINYGNWVNMQEGVRFVKHSKNWHEWAVTHFDLKDTIEKIDINLWDNSSVAHSVVFQSKKIGENNYDYSLKTWENVFLGINAQIGSWVEVGDNTSIWWWTVIKDDVKIWNDVVVWEWVKIKNWIKIPDNCLVPNGAIIRDDFQVITYEEYKRNELQYDTKAVEKRSRRNFVVLLDENDKVKRVEQMDSINKDYTFMSIFNELYVTPENKLFAVINTLLAIIDKHFPKVWVIKEEEFNSTLSFEKVKSYNTWMEDNFIQTELSRKVKLTLKAFPKNKEWFVTDFIPKVIEAIKYWVDITEEIKNELDFPQIPTNKEGVFLWTNTFTWRAKVDGNSFVYDTYIRSDELWEEDIVDIKNSRIIKWVLHWGWDKILTDSNILCTVVHGKMNVFKSNIWNYKHHSVYHNSELTEIEQDAGWVVANWTKVEKSNIWFWILLMPGSKLNEVEVWDYSIIWNREISKCIIWENTYVWNWDRSFEWIYLEWKIYNRKKQELSINLDNSWLENIG